MWCIIFLKYLKKSNTHLNAVCVCMTENCVILNLRNNGNVIPFPNWNFIVQGTVSDLKTSLFGSPSEHQSTVPAIKGESNGGRGRLRGNFERHPPLNYPPLYTFSILSIYRRVYSEEDQRGSSIWGRTSGIS